MNGQAWVRQSLRREAMHTYHSRLNMHVVLSRNHHCISYSVTSCKLFPVLKHVTSRQTESGSRAALSSNFAVASARNTNAPPRHQVTMKRAWLRHSNNLHQIWMLQTISCVCLQIAVVSRQFYDAAQRKPLYLAASASSNDGNSDRPLVASRGSRSAQLLWRCHCSW